jgi:hypothetical protein
VAKPNPWDRRPKESTRAYEAFLAYRDLGPKKRSIDAVVQELGKSRALIGRWCSVKTGHRWVERAAAWDAYQQAERNKVAVAKVREHERKRQKEIDENYQIGLAYRAEVIKFINRRRTSKNPMRLKARDMIALAAAAADLIRATLEAESVAFRGMTDEEKQAVIESRMAP